MTRKASRVRGKIAFQGAPGANSDLACRAAYPGMETLPCAGFEDAFEAVQSGRAKLAMIPIENTVMGRVADVHQLLPHANLHIVGEHFERIEHQLLAPKGATLTIGLVNGGTAHNILARECVFVFDLRSPPGMDHRQVLAPFLAEAEALDRALKARAPEAGVRVETRSDVPPFAPEPDGVAESFVRGLTGDNGPARVVAFAAEAGQFQGAGFSTVICGPGSIAQAHQPDEYVEVAQMQRGAAFMGRLIEWANGA